LSVVKEVCNRVELGQQS